MVLKYLTWDGDNLSFDDAQGIVKPQGTALSSMGITLKIRGVQPGDGKQTVIDARVDIPSTLDSNPNNNHLVKSVQCTKPQVAHPVPQAGTQLR